MSIHHAAPSRSFLAALSQTGPAVHTAAPGATSFAVVLRQASEVAPVKAAAPFYAALSGTPIIAAVPAVPPSAPASIKGAPLTDAVAMGHASKHPASLRPANPTPAATVPGAAPGLILAPAPMVPQPRSAREAATNGPVSSAAGRDPSAPSLSVGAAAPEHPPSATVADAPVNAHKAGQGQDGQTAPAAPPAAGADLRPAIPSGAETVASQGKPNSSPAPGKIGETAPPDAAMGVIATTTHFSGPTAPTSEAHAAHAISQSGQAPPTTRAIAAMSSSPAPPQPLLAIVSPELIRVEPTGAKPAALQTMGQPTDAAFAPSPAVLPAATAADGAPPPAQSPVAAIPVKARSTVAQPPSSQSPFQIAQARHNDQIGLARQTPGDTLATGGDDDEATEASASPADGVSTSSPPAPPVPATVAAATTRHEATNTQNHQAAVEAGGEDTAAAPASQSGPAPEAPADSAAFAAVPDGSDSLPAQPVPGIGQISASAQAASPADATSPAASGAPAIQIAQGVSAMHLSGAGARQITIHLTPGTLGAVQVRIERGTDGSATITLQAEKAETLHALQQDTAHLHEALDRAGLPSAGRQVSYELAQSHANAQADAGSAGLTGSGLGQGGNQGGDSRGGANSQRGQAPNQSYARAEAETPDRSTSTPGRTRAAAASGINITA